MSSSTKVGCSRAWGCSGAPGPGRALDSIDDCFDDCGKPGMTAFDCCGGGPIFKLGNETGQPFVRELQVGSGACSEKDVFWNGIVQVG